ncbi:MAG: SDR family oxidoreductase [Pyrinomonadaceae bacterium]|nr:SDR family oxidoreductase [Pyrinomonadaceae bacterium]
MVTIFITGFPGFIAGRLVEQLADAETRFFLLVQTAFIEKAKQSIEEISANRRVPLENFYLFEGDITKPNLDLSDEDLDLVRAETTDVFHLAAVYDLAVERDLAITVNVEGTKNVNVLAQSIQHLHRYNYISTCYVAGKREGLILENELVHEAGFRNFYEETKYLAEISVENLKDEIPVTIYRPSVVVGDSETGETVKYDGIYSLILYLRKFPQVLSLVNIGNMQVRLNLAPVDFVVEAISALSKDENAVNKTFHIADRNPLTTAELFDVISQNLANHSSLISFPTPVTKQLLMLPLTPTISGLPHVGVPYFFIEQLYDTELSSEMLAKHNVICPPFDSYVTNLLEFVAKHPRL